MEIALGFFFFLGPFLYSFWCIACLFRNARQGGFYQLQRAFGWLSLCTAPMATVQILFAFGDRFRFSDLGERLLVLPGSWAVLMGGQSVVSIFEQNVKLWTGHRRDTMFDNLPVFLALTAGQVLVLTALVWWRFRKGHTMRNPLVLGIGIFMAVNAALAMRWMWFGT